MPYVKPREVPFTKMRCLLLGYGMNGPALARILGCTPGTARLRLAEPERITLGDIRKLNVKGHIPLEELRAAISP